jgi:Fic family protein
VVDLLAAPVAAQVGAAQRALSQFDASMTQAFGGLELGTMNAVLLRSEAASSSQIEHITASSKQIALAQAGQSKSVNARLVAQNVVAMERAIGLARFSTESVTSMQQALLSGTQLQIGPRSEQVWIGTNGMSPVGADFVAPLHQRVPAALADLWSFLGQPSRLPLAHVAVAHAQFETIHPFVDGNGRTGRALVHAYLCQTGLTGHVTVPISAGLLADPRGYVDALTAYRAGDPAAIVSQFARATQNACDIAWELLSGLRDVRQSWSGQLTARRDSVAWKLLDSLVGNPIVTAATVSAHHSVSAVAARHAIAQLAGAGILRKASTGNRNQVWVAEDITACYDRIAVLIGRRQPY